MIFSRLVLLIILSVASLSCFSQIVLIGKVLNQQEELLPFTDVKLCRQTDSGVVLTLQTDTAGNFILYCANSPGNNYVAISMLGYIPAFRNIDTAEKDTARWNVVLKNEPNLLNDVTISSKAPLLERKVDRTVFNVANSIAANGADVYELLKKTPGVQVNNGSVSITGKSTVSIMVNDKLVQIDADEMESFLRSMPAGDVARIEVITTPPAKNDAQGNSGIINIVTKKTRKNGLNATLTGAFEQKQKVSEELNATINYRKDKLNVYGNTSINKERFISKQITNTIYPEQQQNQVLNQDNRPRYTYTQVGADYNLTENAILGVLYTYGTLDGKRDEHYHNDVVRLPVLALDSTIFTNAFATDKGRRNVFDLNYEWKMDTSGKKFTMNADYFTRYGDKGRAFTTSDFFADGGGTGTSSNNQTFGHTKMDITSARADYEMPTKFAILSMGAKASFVHNNSSNVFKQLEGADYVVDTGKTNTFDYHENTEALYLSAQKTLGKWEAQAGIRAEYTQTKGSSLTLSPTNNYNYFKLFPTLYLQYKPNETHSFNINYSRRIDRPSFWIMNPFRVYSTETSYEQGNPFLQPSFSNNFELGYAYKSIFAMTVFTQRINDLITRVSNIDTLNNSFNFGQANAGTEIQYGLTATISFNPVSKWENTTQLFGTYNKFSSTLYNTAVSYSKPSFAIVTNNTFTLNASETLFAELGFSYTSTQQSDFDVQKHFCNLSAGIKVLLLRKKLIFTVDADDILKTDIWQVTNLYNATYQNSYFDNRLLRIALTWKFGNKNIQAKREHNLNTDEMKRAN